MTMRLRLTASANGVSGVIVKSTMRQTEKAVAQLKEYAHYIDSHAEAIIGDIDMPNAVSECGIKISFTLTEYSIPTVTVSKEYLALEVFDHAD